MPDDSWSAKNGCGDNALLEARSVKTHFLINSDTGDGGKARVKAVDGVSLDIKKGEILGVVGESGCGKSTLGRSLLRLEEPSQGEILYRGGNLLDASPGKLKELRRKMQMIFQDPFSSLNPRKRVSALLEQPLKVHGQKEKSLRSEKVEAVMNEMGLDPAYKNRFPHQFSGGQRQRIGIARALVIEPEFVVCDEAVSALDVSVQAQILNLLLDLREKHDLTYLFISHDLSVVEFIASRVLVMYLGRIVERAPTAELVAEPLHPYTKALFESYPNIDPRKRGVTSSVLQGDVPSPISPPPGCHFAPRCPFANDRCHSEYPPAFVVSETRTVNCWLHAS